MDSKQFYINGQWVAPATPQDFPVIDPSTEEQCGIISLGSADDADRAVAAAKAAFPAWAQTPLSERIALLEKFEALFNARKDDIVKAMTSEMGAPRDYSRDVQFAAGADHIRATIEAANKFTFEERRDDCLITHEPIGVVAMITPWNWPMNQVVLKIAPALIVGATLVLKPSEIAPLSSLIVAELIHEAGFPKGVFNLVNGDGAGVGSRLSQHPDVDMVSFTGSTRAGIAISKVAADTIKRVSLELGGKGANIIFADADDDAVSQGIAGCFDNAGQSCDAPTRMLVERSIYDKALEKAEAAAKAQKVASGHESGDHIGPVVSDVHWNKIQGLIQAGIDDKGRLLTGGTGKPDGLEKGYFVKPTVFADITPDMTIANEEIFGPVLAIMPFDTEEEAIQIANDTPYGLGNYVQTRDPERALRVAKRLRSGTVNLNGGYGSVNTPFGGYKQSGNGREGSDWGLMEYLEVKSINGL
ncbi:MAG: aldehyde dehydrogenase family protein [Hyphomicrobiales bacterium]